MLWSRPEPDFLAVAGAGEKAAAPGCCYLAKGYCGGKVATILVRFSHISTIYTQIERKIGTLKNPPALNACAVIT